MGRDYHACARRCFRSAPPDSDVVSISANRKEYYDELNRAQRGTVDVTPWVLWFWCSSSTSLVVNPKRRLRNSIKARFWTRLASVPISDRQRKVINVLLDAGLGGFEGGLSAGKYQSLTSTSRQTATRDLADLVDKGVLRMTGQLKSTRYYVVVPEWQ